MQSPIPNMLAAWRDAERRWERMLPEDPEFGSARLAVLQAWFAYQESVGYLAPDELVLVADDEMRYVAANARAHEVLGYGPGGMVGLRVADITPPAESDAMQASWDAFRRIGRLDGPYELRRSDGETVSATFTARAHFPVAGLHTSRLRLAGG